MTKAMTKKEHKQNGKTRIGDLLDFGISRSCYCRSDPNIVNDDISIIYTGLDNGYTLEDLKLFVDYFGKEKMLKAVETHKKSFTQKFYQDLKKHLCEIH